MDFRLICTICNGEALIFNKDKQQLLFDLTRASVCAVGNEHQAMPNAMAVTRVEEM
jgi:hypothetical protein